MLVPLLFGLVVVVGHSATASSDNALVIEGNSSTLGWALQAPTPTPSPAPNATESATAAPTPTCLPGTPDFVRAWPVEPVTGDLVTAIEVDGGRIVKFTLRGPLATYTSTEEGAIPVELLRDSDNEFLVEAEVLKVVWANGCEYGGQTFSTRVKVEHDSALAEVTESMSVMSVVSCLDGNGRVDLNIVNTSAEEADYRVEFEGLRPRQRTVSAGDWWRMPVTGRADGSYDIVVLRDDVQASTESVVVSCDSGPPVVGDELVRLISACRFDRGYLVFQFVNPTHTEAVYTIEFDGGPKVSGVPNRSVTVPAYGQAVRAVTGRSDGRHYARIRGSDLAAFWIDVDC